ncbi:MAG: SGNH/GDSL hydrolase family protein [Nocardioidaceae bacterium]|nr:SGNH/GDSL hydrolase family protein [Nocardioidaceae bacterium]
MSRMRGTRVLAAAAYYAGGVGVGVGGLVGLVKLEAYLARRTIGPADDGTADPDGVYAAELPGEPIRMLLIGDSSAAGYGMVDPLDTPAAMLASGLAHIAHRPVRVCSRAAVGARSAGLDRQIDRGLAEHPDVTIIVVGANDVTHGVRPVDAVHDLVASIRRLRETGSQVVVGTCPDLGTIRPLAPPLRQIARQLSRRLAAAQTGAVIAAGGHAVSLRDVLAMPFLLTPGELFGDDRFHPSLTGYAGIATAMLPVVARALGVWDDDEPVDLATVSA